MRIHVGLIHCCVVNSDSNVEELRFDVVQIDIFSVINEIFLFRIHHYRPDVNARRAMVSEAQSDGKDGKSKRQRTIRRFQLFSLSVQDPSLSKMPTVRAIPPVFFLILREVSVDVLIQYPIFENALFPSASPK